MARQGFFSLLVAIPLLANWAQSSSPQTWASLSSIGAATWNALNATVGGRLHEGAPMMSPCYPSSHDPTQPLDAAQCTAEQELLLNSTLASNEFPWYHNVRHHNYTFTTDNLYFAKVWKIVRLVHLPSHRRIMPHPFVSTTQYYLRARQCFSAIRGGARNRGRSSHSQLHQISRTPTRHQEHRS